MHRGAQDNLVSYPPSPSTYAPSSATALVPPPYASQPSFTPPPSSLACLAPPTPTSSSTPYSTSVPLFFLSFAKPSSEALFTKQDANAQASTVPRRRDRHGAKELGSLLGRWATTFGRWVMAVLGNVEIDFSSKFKAGCLKVFENQWFDKVCFWDICFCCCCCLLMVFWKWIWKKLMLLLSSSLVEAMSAARLEGGPRWRWTRREQRWVWRKEQMRV